MSNTPLPLRAALTVLLLTLTVCLGSEARAQDDIDRQSIDRADRFLKTAKHGRDVLGAVHFGAQYNGHTYVETRRVRNRPGQFALVYKFNWESDGVTDIAFLCDGRGSVYEVQVVSTNAVLQQPYALANASINVLGNVLLNTFQNQMTAEDIQQARRFIDNPNARGLLEMSLKLQQAFGQ